MGCFSPFPHGTGSLSVRNEYLALRDGPRGFKQGFSCPALLRYLLRVWIVFAYGSVTLFGSPFQKIQLTTRLVTLLLQALQPPRHRNVTGLGCSDFARHYYRNRGFFLFLLVRKSPDQRVCAAPRSLSQLAASFIACFCQGIHRAPLVA